MILKDWKAALDLPAKPEEFPRLTEWLETILDEVSFSPRSGQQILICADEVAANIASYAYPAGEGSLSVSVNYHAAAKELEIIFSDHGIPFDPLCHEPPDPSVPMEQRKPGGMGILVVRRMMDRVTYSREGDRNVLTLVKRSGGGEIK